VAGPRRRGGNAKHAADKGRCPCTRWRANTQVHAEENGRVPRGTRPIWLAASTAPAQALATGQVLSIQV
jgi:hypothetical protein